MTRPTFDLLAAAWRDLAAHTAAGGIGPSNVFVPWAGKQLIVKSRGIYYVGIAPDKKPLSGKQSFKARLRSTEDFCGELSLGHAPFWAFLNQLTLKIFGRAYDETQDLWGWSNLLKIAGVRESPEKWPSSLIDRQRAACIAALKEEIVRLRDSLIVVASTYHYGILYEVFGEERLWNKNDRPGGTYHRRDPVTGNIFVHCYHPRPALQKRFFDEAVAEIVGLVRQRLPPF